MKYIVLIGDGMPDLGKTPLEIAKTPNMDFIAQHGVAGWVNNVPKGLPPASDVANMSIFGYDPKKYYTGRGPLEAASLGVKLAKDEIAFRCNLVTVKDRKMKDFTAGHISTKEADKIMKTLNKKLGRKGIKFYTGLSYRHLLVINQKLSSDKVKTTPPHDITGQKIGNYLPKGNGADILLQLMSESEVLLHDMKTRATMIWPWSPGKAPKMPSFKKLYKKSGAIITAVHLLKGIGKIAGMEVINVPGATGYLDTNYLGKARYAINALKRNDVVFVHVESPDEAGHEGSLKKKVRAIQDFDKQVVGTVLNEVKKRKGKLGIAVLSDHPTPIKVMTHTRDDVLFAVYPSGVRSPRSNVFGFNEKAFKKTKIRIKEGNKLLKLILGGKL